MGETSYGKCRYLQVNWEFSKMQLDRKREKERKRKREKYNSIKKEKRFLLFYYFYSILLFQLQTFIFRSGSQFPDLTHNFLIWFTISSL